ncbi:DUF1761 domain-containing protein [Promicromonospora iranensis]|uniref:Divalent metal cation (Fe/Co/Zn/Cd) transporter n=1 Tax=Promicromonospora iranensis TaxID=1105144 RepID=A0ABU2CH52_9MICO|nr:DUF1761 domain-containing protein [Promicromonospora iranensis]MDR7380663.1 divalent metal cation (Fe/Co/Zn/Cd) transporter [Promicromonospora iranensis]
MIPEVNYWAVIVATLSTVVVGAVWYTPKVLGNRWTELTRVGPKSPNQPTVWPFVVVIVGGFVTVWVLAGATYISWEFYEGSFLTAAIVTAVLLWVGFTVARVAIHDAFEGRPAALTTINLGHELVTILVVAVIIGVWPPAGV